MSQTTSLQESVNEFTKMYGVTDVQNMYDAAIATIATVKNVCFPLVGIAFILVFLNQMTKWAIGERTIDYIAFFRFFLLALLLANYEEVLTQVNTLIAYFCNAIGPGIGNYSSGLSIPDKVNTLLERTRNKEDYSLWTDGLNNIMDWIVSNATQLIIVVARAIVYAIREIYMMFLMAVGPIALLLSMFPILQGSAVHWFKSYISVGLWALTMSVLDLLLNTYLDRMLSTNNDSGLVIMNIGIMLMYLSVPYITSKFIGGLQSRMMQRFSGLGVTVGRSAGNTIMAAGTGGASLAGLNSNSSNGLLWDETNVRSVVRAYDTVEPSIGGLVSGTANAGISQNRPIKS